MIDHPNPRTQEPFVTAETGTPQDAFLAAFRGGFTAALRWPQLDALWERLRERADAGWYLYALGETPPTTPATDDQVLAFIDVQDLCLHAYVLQRGSLMVEQEIP